MEQLFNLVAENFIVATIGGCFVVGMVLKSVTTILTSISRERSRREIAAYIAEGSICPEQGERLMRGDVDNNRGPANC